MREFELEIRGGDWQEKESQLEIESERNFEIENSTPSSPRTDNRAASLGEGAGDEFPLE